MTMAEFRLREYAYVREQQWDWAKYRLVGFMAIRAFNISHKSVPKKLGDVMGLPFVDGPKIGGVTDSQLEAIKQAQERFINETKLKQIG